MDASRLGIIVFELVVMVVAISLHDCAQAFAANRMGDPTARMMGRITMNPAKHYDMWGTILWPLVSLLIFHSSLPYGWGKPVPMTYRNFPKKNGEMLSVLAGPAAQFFAAVVALVVLLVLKHTSMAAKASMDLVVILANFHTLEGVGELPSIFPVLFLLYLAIVINLLLCVFNLLPMPFLDGGKILMHFLPYNAGKAFQQYSMFFMIGFFLLAGPIVGMVFGPLLSVFTGLLQSL